MHTQGNGGRTAWSEGVVVFTFLAIDPDSPQTGSPTVWRDEQTGDLVVQGWKADRMTLAECARVGSVPGHSTDVPEHETVVRLPARMIPALKAALA